MTDYPSPLKAHLLRDCTTVCHAWRLTRRDGNISGYTDHDRALEIDGTICEPGSGFTGSEAQKSLGFGIDTLDIEGALSSVGLVEEEIEAGLFDDAIVEMFLVNWRSPGDFALVRKTTIGTITLRDGAFLAELKSRMHTLDQPNARYLTRACGAELGDSRCGFDVETSGFAGAGEVVGEIAPDAYRVSGLGGFEADWFTHGVLTWTSGPRNGRVERIADHRRQGEDALLYLVPVEGVQPEPGNTFSILAGCDKSFTSCRQKFANHLRFRGFPHLPGNDSAYAYVSDGLVFDGEPLVP